MPAGAEPSLPADLQAVIDAFVGGDETKAEALCRYLTPLVRGAAAKFLGRAGAEVDDVVQDSLLGVLTYLRRRDSFTGDLPRLAIAIANNRCRDLLRARARHPQVEFESYESWLADPARSPLDLLAEAEVRTLLQRALDELEPACRNLLRAFYLAGTSIEEIRQQSGLTTVQGVYHRRAICLQTVAKLLNKRLAGRPVPKGRPRRTPRREHGGGE